MVEDNEIFSCFLKGHCSVCYMFQTTCLGLYGYGMCRDYSKQLFSFKKHPSNVIGYLDVLALYNNCMSGGQVRKLQSVFPYFSTRDTFIQIGTLIVKALEIAICELFIVFFFFVRADYNPWTIVFIKKGLFYQFFLVFVPLVMGETKVGYKNDFD